MTAISEPPTVASRSDPFASRKPAEGPCHDRLPPLVGKRIAFVAWRDLANPEAGGSEVLIDHLAEGLSDAGNEVGLLCGGPHEERPYQVVRSGGKYSQYALAPFHYARHFRGWDLLVEVCNGMPFCAPLWRRGRTVCLVNHMHRVEWGLAFPPPIAAAGRAVESKIMPRVHRRSAFVTVSRSSAAALQDLGVAAERIHVIRNGVETPNEVYPESRQPLFVALTRLMPQKHMDVLVRIWDRVRTVVGGELIIAGDGPERERLQSMRPVGVHFPGRISEEEKHRLLCKAWLLVHPSAGEGWGLVISEAAIRCTPAIGFQVPGICDSVIHGETGLLADSEDDFVSSWLDLAANHGRRRQMGAAARRNTVEDTWSRTVEQFTKVLIEVHYGRQEAESLPMTSQVSLKWSNNGSQG